METNNILNADVLDIIFEGKNKEYGAYQLRKTYNKRLMASMLTMSSVCLLLFLSSLLANDNDKGNRRIAVKDIQFESVKEQKKVEPPPPPKPPKPQQKVEVAKFTPPRIVIDSEVKPDDEIREIKDLEDVAVGSMNIEGVKEDHLVAPPIEKTTGVVEGPKVIKENFEETFTKVEKEAAFPGGADAWRRYLERNLNADVATENGAPVGYYTVKVQFIVDKEGSISNVTAIDVPKACAACGPEAVKVIKRGPKWEPAIQNGSRVIYQAIQHITFQVAEE